MKWPEPGRVKTRLVAQLGEEGAARLYEWMLMRTVRTAEQAAGHCGLHLVAAFDPAPKRARFLRLLTDRWMFVAQAPGSLGTRLHRAFQDCFSAGRGPVLAIGTDCPWLTAQLLCEARAKLLDYDVVFGPTEDGGYYLIGLRRMQGELFKAIPWSSSKTLATSLERARAVGMRVTLLERLSDVDRPADLAALRRDFPEAPLGTGVVRPNPGELSDPPSTTDARHQQGTTTP